MRVALGLTDVQQARKWSLVSGRQSSFLIVFSLRMGILEDIVCGVREMHRPMISDHSSFAEDSAKNTTCLPPCASRCSDRKWWHAHCEKEGTQEEISEWLTRKDLIEDFVLNGPHTSLLCAQLCFSRFRCKISLLLVRRKLSHYLLTPKPIWQGLV